MPVLIAAVVLVGALCTLDLVLTLGVVKRLREHTALISKMANSQPSRPPVIGVGEEVGEFSAVAVGGDVLTRESLVGDTLVAFFSPSCGPCHEMLPKFVEYARAVDGGREQVLAVVVGSLDRAKGQVAELSPVARVVVEGGSEAIVADAFQIKGFPTLLKVRQDADGRQVIAGNQVDLDAPVAVA
ncbi:TlpA disulfide reductase family protein [Streptomyces sp. UNOC14_S4]|uniref:TlpA family protein disulfide reductase n=1 Tax=Streptomyces sp. UNOC14_S4 TaxID=2872340 RepID=UPI001E54C5FB|nr:TlpA disulfide reductase family protein [Streptomyces sp. UNOC14_S4]MCC3769325.1 TlpA family protein disulfide reductase [Streptomyces sp. UNOC14_S4]